MGLEALPESHMIATLLSLRVGATKVLTSDRGLDPKSSPICAQRELFLHEVFLSAARTSIRNPKP